MHPWVLYMQAHVCPAGLWVTLLAAQGLPRKGAGWEPLDVQTLRNEAGRMEVQHLFKILLIYTVTADRLLQEHWFVHRHLDFCTPLTPSLY